MNTPHVRPLFSGRTDVGSKRAENQDCFAINARLGLMVVADGMGGHAGGRIAARLVCDHFVSSLEKLAPDTGDTAALRHGLYRSALAANSAVRAAAAADPELEGMGSTLVAAVVGPEHLLTVHIGDSRAYMATPEGELTQLTADHSFVANLVAEGLSLEQAMENPMRNMLTRAVGTNDEVEPELGQYPLEQGARVLLCSDGLWSMVDDGAIGNMLCRGQDPDRIAGTLVNAANEAGGKDNITAAVALV